MSEMKKLAARDFEDLLQVGTIYTVHQWQSTNQEYKCAIPVFDGLLPEPHNSTIMRLLFTCAHWHGLAKLRMHTDITLSILDKETVRIGTEFRAFAAKTCPSFKTRELCREAEARKRRHLKKEAAPSCSSNIPSMGDSQIGVSKEDGRRLKSFNIDTYKYHALGDYAKTIRQLGTTDSFSTQPVSHCTTTAYPILMCCFLYRASLNIVGPRLGSSALIANYSSNS
jgi:hypothetical protein